MSFIVDAARRRQLDEEPSQAATWAYSQMRSRQRRLWMVVGFLALVALALMGALVMRWFASPGIADFPPVVESEPAVPQSADDPASGSPVTETTPQGNPVAETPYYQPIENEAAEEEIYRAPVRLAEAPPAIQEELLLFRYSSHLYSNEPAGRSMSVNGQRVREGDSLEHWTVDEITEDGVIWDNGDLLVEVNVLDLWN